MTPIEQTLYEAGILPVIAIDDAQKAVPLAKALLDGGISVAEVTFRTAAAGEAIRQIRQQLPQMLVGAGTVLTREQVDQAIELGCAFLVTPGFNREIVEYALQKGIPIFPGAATPGEMEQAMGLGLETVKFFPAEQNGGPAKLKALSGPYRNLRFMPTGGINEKNLLSYLSMKQVLACGGSWMVKPDLVKEENWTEITRLARQAVATMLDFSLVHVGINCTDPQQAGAQAAVLQQLFCFPFTQGRSSIFCGSREIELTLQPGRGTHGHLAIGTASVDRAAAYLTAQKIPLDLEHASCKDGRLQSVYLQEEIAGFAIHLLQK